MIVVLTNPNNKKIKINIEPNIGYMYEYFDNLHRENEGTDVDVLLGNCLQYSFNIKDTKVLRVWEEKTQKDIYNFRNEEYNGN